MQLFLLWLIPGRKRTSRGKGKFRITCHLHDSIKNSHLTSKTSAFTVVPIIFCLWFGVLHFAKLPPNQSAECIRAVPWLIQQMWQRLRGWCWKTDAYVWSDRVLKVFSFVQQKHLQYWRFEKTIFQLQLFILWLCLSPQVCLKEIIRKLFFYG